MATQTSPVWYLTPWTIGAGGWIVQPILTINGQDFKFATPKSYVAKMKSAKLEGPNVAIFIKQFEDVYDLWEQATTPPPPPPVVVPTTLGIPGLIDNLQDLRLKANAAVSDFVRAWRPNIDLNLRLSTVFRDEAGVTQYGKAERVISGQYANGKPKYKTIVTKFAILDFYDKKLGKRGSKISTTLIGTIDSLALKPTTEQLAEINQKI